MSFSDGDNRGLGGSTNEKDLVKRANLGMQDPQRVKNRYRGTTPSGGYNLNSSNFAPPTGDFKAGQVQGSFWSRLGGNLNDIPEVEYF